MTLRKTACAGSGLLWILLIHGCGEKVVEKQNTDNIYEGIEFEMPVVSEPRFPDYTVSIEDFGAVNDGQTLNTEAIAKAIADVSEKGGGHVIIPRGIWLTGPVTMKSHVDLHAEEGSLILFSKNKDLYPLTESYFEGWKTVRCTSPINGRDLEDIAITGKGVFDGSGEVWRAVKREKLTEGQWKKLVKSGGIISEDEKMWYPSESYLRGSEMHEDLGPRFSDNLEDYGETKDFYRPVMVSLINCNGVLLDGPVFQNSPAWCIHPMMCENLTVRNVRVRNPWFSQNGDGIDIESCTNSLVYNCTFDVGDDAICIKSGKDEEGRERGMPTENLVVKNCIVYHGHGGVTIGSEMSGGVRNIHVSGCTFLGTDVGLRFKSNRGRGGVVEKIYISDIDMIEIPTNAISFNLYYGGLEPSDLMNDTEGPSAMEAMHPVTDATPEFREIRIRNITCKGANQAIYLQGLPEMNLEDVSMENMVMESEKGLFCIDAHGIKIKNLTLITDEHPALVFYNTKNTVVEGLNVNGPVQSEVLAGGDKTENITVDGKPVV